MSILHGGKSASVQSTVLRNVVRLLEGLNQTAVGIIIHDQLNRVLQLCEAEHDAVERVYASLAFVLLRAYAQKPDVEHVLHVTAQFIRIPITAPLDLKQVEDFRRRIAVNEPHPDLSRESDIQAFTDAVMALMRQYGATPPAAAEVEPAADVSPVSKTPVHAAPDDGATTRAGEKDDQKMWEDMESQESASPAADRRVNSAYRLHLDRKRDEIEKLQEMLSRKVEESIAQNKEFGVLLEIERSALQQAENIHEIEALRTILIGGIDELLAGQRELGAKLRGSSDYLGMVRSDSARLHEELHKVRLLSLTDEFTGLPNRRAFMRRLEDEIGRAQRYGTPLALAVMDLDEFKTINDTFGHAAGDEVLRCYATNVLSVFRHHDMVARYGGEEFSVLLPNTSQEGALCALRKVQKRVDKTHFVYGGRTLSLPTFSAGLTLYLPGEPPSVLIDRADKALYSAKRLGRNRVEVEAAASSAVVAEFDDIPTPT